MAADSEVTFTVVDSSIEGHHNVPARLRVSRAVYDQPSFDSTYGLCEPGPPLSPWENVKRLARKKWRRNCGSSKKCDRASLYRGVVRWFPVVEWLRKYDVRGNFLTDFIAGITVGVLNVPQGMAYAMLANCPPVVGLYTSFFPILVYFLMGTSRQCSMGTFSIISMMTSKIVLQYGTFAKNENGTVTNPAASEKINGSDYTVEEWSEIQVASAASFLIGLWQLLFGLLGLGGAAVYLSDQLVQGFTCAASFHVFTSQLKSVFGLPLTEFYGPFKIIKTYVMFFSIVKDTNIPAFVVGLICFIFLVIVKMGINDNRRIMRVIRIPIPAELIIVIFATLASYLMDLNHVYKVPIVKHIPEGLPPPTLPDMKILTGIIGDTFSNAIVGLAITVTLGMLYASKHGYSIDPNQEFKAQGLGNIFGCWFQCIPSGASLARSAVQNDVGGKTQIVSVVQCSIVLIVVLWLGRFLEPLPKSALGAIVMVSVFHLLAQAVQLRKLWTLSLVDWSIFLVVFLGVLILDVDIGLAIGVGWAIMTIMLRLQKPKVGPLGRLPGTDIYRRTDVYKTATEIPGVKIVRVDAPIYFANAAYIKQRLYALADIQNLIKNYREANPVKSVDMPALNDASTEYAYSLNLQLHEDEEAQLDAGELGARFGSTISMEELFSSKKPMTEGHRQVEDEEDVPTKHLIIDCSEICFIDVTGVGFLKKCHLECASVGVQLLLACTNKPVRDTLYACDHWEVIKDHQLFVTVHDAVLYAVNSQAFSHPMRKDGGYLNPQFSPKLGDVPEEDEEGTEESKESDRGFSDDESDKPPFQPPTPTTTTTVIIR